jgi:ubiquinone/menaquinone biosynthesis C-methylase UbiE
MATATSNARPTPERIFNTLNAFQDAAALKTAIQLDLFTAIAEGHNEAAALAKRIGAAERGARILADYLTVHGFLTKAGSVYALTPETALFLDRKSPAYLGTITGFLASDRGKKSFDLLPEAVRKGGTAMARGDNTEPQDEFWVSFAKSMAPLTAPAAAFMAEVARMSEAKPSKILDVAASHGMYGITFAKQNPHAHIAALDWPAVLEVAKENARAAGVADRFTFLPGSVFEADLGTGYDIVLLTNILHHFDTATNERLLRRIHAALKPGGRAMTLEFVPNEDRVSPPTSASFSIVMLTITDSGDAYTFAEYDSMFRNAGFSKSELHQLPNGPQQLVVSEKLQ